MKDYDYTEWRKPVHVDDVWLRDFYYVDEFDCMTTHWLVLSDYLPDGCAYAGGRSYKDKGSRFFYWLGHP